MCFDDDKINEQGKIVEISNWFDEQNRASETDCPKNDHVKVLNVIGPYEIDDSNREYYKIIDNHIEKLKGAGYVANKIELIFPIQEKWPLHFVRRFEKQVEATDVLSFAILTDNWYSTIAFFIAMYQCVDEFEDEIANAPLKKDDEECDEDSGNYYPEISQCRFVHYPYSDVILDPCNPGIRIWTISFREGDGYIDKNFAMNFLSRLEGTAKRIEKTARQNQGFDRSSYEAFYGLLETGLFI